MIVARLLSLLGFVFFILLVGYILYTFSERRRNPRVRFRLSVILTLLVLALLSNAIGASVVVIDAGEVGVVFNAITGLQDTPLMPGMHILIPYINEVYRYSTREQVYTMTKTYAEGEVLGDDSLWSPTIEGLQVGIDSSTRYRIKPEMAPYIHNNFRYDYREILIRPSIRSIVRHYVSQHTVAEIYGPKRAEIQEAITEALRERFEPEGFELLSFDIRNVNFTDEYAKAIEQKQIAQQQAEQMEYVLQREQQEAERKRVEAEGLRDAAITQAEGEARAVKIRAQAEAEALALINEVLSKNPQLLQYKYIEKLAPNVTIMLLPANSPYLFDLQSLIGQAEQGRSVTPSSPSSEMPGGSTP